MSNQPPFPPPPPPPTGGNPYGQNPYGGGGNPQNPYGGNPYQQNPMGMQQDLPNATAVLVLGIVSIVTCWCWGIPGLACGIIALIMANKSLEMYRNNPSGFTPSSYKNLNAGRICAIIGLVLSAIDLVLVIIGLSTDNYYYYNNPWRF